MASLCQSACLATCLLALPPATLGADDAVYSGRANETAVAIPRLDGPLTVDGILDEPVWELAAELTDFSQYAPNDARPAENETRVLVWYGPTAIHFGIRADAVPGSVRATLGDRDRIDGDDQIQIYLSTYNDGRQAVMFAVNPLGVQADGAIVEGVRQTGGGFGGLQSGRETVDLSPDFVFESKGRVTESGYEVEIRIPFKSLRYQAVDVQHWGLHVIRRVESTGHEDSWAPAQRAASSFLGQAGTLQGLTDLRRGVVLDITPIVTTRIDGAPGPGAGGWRYDPAPPDFGANLRWGITPNLTLDGTVNPDFSQVEADAGQFQFDPRQALFFSEKRPFFLEGLEQFETPNRLVYTRRVVAPLAAVKLTGKLAGTTLAALTAVDDRTASTTGADRPLFNVVRVQRDVGRASRLGFVYTDRVDGRRSSRLAGVDTRLAFRDVYSLQLQAAVSRTAQDGRTTTAPLWHGVLARSGRRYGFRYSLRAVADDFRADAGFISRRGIVQGTAVNQITLYGPASSRLERWTGDVTLDGTWQYEDFVNGRASQDRKLQFHSNFTFRGGWRTGQSVLIETFGYDRALYADYALLRQGDAGAQILPFVGTPRLPNLDYVLTLSTPRVRGVSANGFLIWGRDENFFEWASADILFVNLGVAWRPTERLRVDGTYQLQQYKRRTDGSTVGVRRIPRLKVEYQMTRAVFFRVVSQYDAEMQDDLRDDSRTDLPILIRDRATGEFRRALGFSRSTLRTDWLFSYQPTPGTVLFAGYGSTLADPDRRDTRPRRRTTDGFFFKMSYLFRL